MYIPPELVQEIIAFTLDFPSTASDEPGVSVKQNWSSIQPLSLASKAYRALTLDIWFRTLFIKEPSDMESLRTMFPDISGRIRELHCVQADKRNASIWDLYGLTHVSRIRLDWLSRSMFLPLYTSKDQGDRGDRLPFIHLSSSVTELDIRGLQWPSPVLLENMHHILPDLNVLRLQQQKIWCGLCHTCSVAKFRSPGPEKIVYEGGGGLPIHYARAFGTLQHLHTVFITMADFGGGSTTLQEGDEYNKYLWAGECDRCIEIMYEDDAFRDAWVARKQGLASVNKETTKSMYVPPPALKRVEWRFWKAEGFEELEVQESGDESSGSEEE